MWIWMPKKKKKSFFWDMNDKEREEFVENQNKKITHILWIIFISMITAMLTVYLATGSIGL